MRRSVALFLLVVVGCGSSSKPDTDAAREYVRSFYSNPAIALDITINEEPEYANIPKLPRKFLGKSAPDTSAACGVRVRFTWRDENRTTHDNWVVWVTSDHKAVGWSGNPDGDNWRQAVRSLAKE
ncbi:MAG TPA: hypothetical protein VGZ22_18360 [Isosphaeraceae bacterium]|jgi:hypothetical protein|nr:hypothetical protein [Isosphaeraceae bacterium]